MHGIDDVRFLASSTSRFEVLAHLAETTNDLRTLRDETGTPRSTLQRNLSELSERGWVTRTDDGLYEATPVGKLLVEDFRQLCETASSVADLSSVPESVPIAEFDFDLRHLADGNVTLSGDGTPYAPASRVVDLLEESTRVRAVTPCYNPTYAEVLAHRLSRVTMDVELIVPRSHLYRLRGNSYAKLGELANAENALIRLYDGEIPYGLAVIDDVAVIEGQSDEGVNAVLDSTAAPVCTWAEEKYLEYRAASSPLAEAPEPN